MAKEHMADTHQRHHKERQGMHTRHEKEASDMAGRHMQEMGMGDSEAVGGQPPQGQTAQGMGE